MKNLKKELKILAEKIKKIDECQKAYLKGWIDAKVK